MKKKVKGKKQAEGKKKVERKKRVEVKNKVEVKKKEGMKKNLDKKRKCNDHLIFMFLFVCKEEIERRKAHLDSVLIRSH